MVEVTPLLDLVLLGSIFDRIFDFIFLSFEPYHVVHPFTVQCPLCHFLVSVCQSKDLSKVISNFFKTQSRMCLMKYLT